MGDVKIQRNICASIFRPASLKTYGGVYGYYGDQKKVPKEILIKAATIIACEMYLH